MRNRILGALGFVLLTVAAIPAQAQTYSERPGSWHYGWDWGWDHMIFGSLMMVIFWGGLVLLIVLAVRKLGGDSAGSAQPPAPRTSLDILREHFARGEFDKEEFEERKRLLSE